MLYGMFFLMSFALEHGYGDSPLAAGLRLAVIPVALGIVAPFSGALSDRLGARMLSAAGMAFCVAALVILVLAEADPAASRLVSTGGVRPVRCRPRRVHRAQQSRDHQRCSRILSGEAGSMLNLMRALGTSLGVASASVNLVMAARGHDGFPRRLDSLRRSSSARRGREQPRDARDHGDRRRRGVAGPEQELHCAARGMSGGRVSIRSRARLYPSGTKR